MEPKNLAGLLGSWLLSVVSLATWLEKATGLLTLAAAAGSLALTVITIRVQLATKRCRELEQQEREIEVSEAQAKLCAQCRAGNEPPQCPYPEGGRPEGCKWRAES